MSLFKQLFIAICALMLVSFTGSFLVSVESSREQQVNQLRAHAQDAATALGLAAPTGHHAEAAEPEYEALRATIARERARRVAAIPDRARTSSSISAASAATATDVALASPPP